MNEYLGPTPARAINPYGDDLLNPDVFPGVNQVVDTIEGIDRAINSSIRSKVENVDERIQAIWGRLIPTVGESEITSLQGNEGKSQSPIQDDKLEIGIQSANQEPIVSPPQPPVEPPQIKPELQYDKLWEGTFVRGSMVMIQACLDAKVGDSLSGFTVPVFSTIPNSPNTLIGMSLPISGFIGTRLFTTGWVDTIGAATIIAAIKPFLYQNNPLNLKVIPNNPSLMVQSPIGYQVPLECGEKEKLPPIEAPKPIETTTGENECVTKITCPPPIIKIDCPPPIIQNIIKIPEPKLPEPCEKKCDKINDPEERELCLEDCKFFPRNWIEFTISKRGKRKLKEYAKEMGFIHPLLTSEALMEDVKALQTFMMANLTAHSPYSEKH